MAPNGLITLPSEILLSICKHMCPHCSTFASEWSDEDSGLALLSLVQTCWRLHKITQPIQYHAVRPQNIFCFLRTLIERPDLAAKVRWFDSVDVTISEPSEEDLGTLEQAALCLPINEFEMWFETIIESDIDRHQRLLELTLAFLPNTEKLRIMAPFCYEINLDSSITESVLMESVTTLQMIPQGAVDLGLQGDFLAMMPCLKNFKVQRCGGVSQYLPLSEVCSLWLENCFICEQSLQKIIGSCPKLEYFKYSSFEHVPLDADPFTWGQVQRVLRSRRETLKTANFEFGETYLTTRDEPLGPGDYLGSFHDFEKLETLWVRTTSFGTRDDQTIPTFPATVQDLISKLPGSLICLVFCGSHKNWDGIRILATAIREGHFPKLKTVMVEQGQKEFEESCEILAAVGVVCGFLNNTLYDSFPLCLHRQFMGETEIQHLRAFG